ncbi:MAG TPA: hypothetical protein VH866_09730 [Candidatus Deferrimicrobiaceae bacterium]|jgi:hypothetical protein
MNISRSAKAPSSGPKNTDASPSSAAPARKIAAALTRPPTHKRSREILVLELRRLRALFIEIAERYVANVEGKSAALIKTVEEGKLSAATVAELLAGIRDLAVKPQKGRRKDLARIERTIEALQKALET